MRGRLRLDLTTRLVWCLGVGSQCSRWTSCELACGFPHLDCLPHHQPVSFDNVCEAKRVNVSNAYAVVVGHHQLQARPQYLPSGAQFELLQLRSFALVHRTRQQAVIG